MAGGAGVLALLFVACVVFSVLSDSATKRVLQQDGDVALSLTAAQLVISGLVGLVLSLVLSGRPQMPMSRLAALATPLYFLHGLGFAFTNSSMGIVAVSFTHTIKASEILFTASLSAVVLKERLPLQAYLTLLPIVCGVALSAMSEMTFSVLGFNYAMVSNACFALRSVVSRQRMKGGVDNFRLYYVMCLGASAILLPLAYWAEGTRLLQHTDPRFFLEVLLSGLCHYTYNLCSYMVLQRTTALNHVVMHSVRRVVVIFSTVLYFGNSVKPLNWLGSFLVFAGVLLYTASKNSAQSATPATSTNGHTGTSNGNGHITNGNGNGHSSHTTATLLAAPEAGATMLRNGSRRKTKQL